jgi:hypothetical protein
MTKSARAKMTKYYNLAAKLFEEFEVSQNPLK